jgi:hypothetical protein
MSGIQGSGVIVRSRSDVVGPSLGVCRRCLLGTALGYHTLRCRVVLSVYVGSLPVCTLAQSKEILPISRPI